MPVGACWSVAGQRLLPCTGGSAIDLSATGAWRRAAAGDSAMLRLQGPEVELIRCVAYPTKAGPATLPGRARLRSVGARVASFPRTGGGRVVKAGAAFMARPTARRGHRRALFRPLCSARHSSSNRCKRAGITRVALQASQHLPLPSSQALWPKRSYGPLQSEHVPVFISVPRTRF
jgi:hypothetical protein